ncbi:hypothetical protein ASF38_03280 [Aeromicrobium sp. Leaf272]|nr:hypothetical protein ASF38_03280 [Aeromicrobium sp. Leaf272]
MPWTAARPIWPAPEHSSSTPPSGREVSSSAAQRDWAYVHGRGSSTVSSTSIDRGPNGTVRTVGAGAVCPGESTCGTYPEPGT